MGIHSGLPVWSLVTSTGLGGFVRFVGATRNSSAPMFYQSLTRCCPDRTWQVRHSQSRHQWGTVAASTAKGDNAIGLNNVSHMRLCVQTAQRPLKPQTSSGPSCHCLDQMAFPFEEMLMGLNAFTSSLGLPSWPCSASSPRLPPSSPWAPSPWAPSPWAPSPWAPSPWAP